MSLFKQLFKLIFISLLAFIFLEYKTTWCSLTEEKTFNILILNSYNAENEWERLVDSGLKEKLSVAPNINLTYEFLDSKTLFTEEYKNSFMKLLNMKYKNTPIDVILTVDDEALSFLRENLFVENSILYKKPTIFIGANNSIQLSVKEKYYMSGVVEVEDNLRFLNLLIDLEKNLKDVLVLLDNSTFCSVLKNNIFNMKSLASKSLNISFIEKEYIEDIISEISKSDPKSSALVIIGEYKDKINNSYLDLSDTIKIIRNNTNTPIYTKVQPYIFAGAIGGIVDTGDYHGSVAGELILKLASGIPINEIPLVYNSLDLTIFNYDSLNYYHINPLLLPKESIVLNRGPFDFLLPPFLKILLWIFIISFIIFISYIIIFSLKQKRSIVIKDAIYKKALETEKLKSIFITTMSHEFRTPINIILATSHLLSIKIEDPSTEKEYIIKKLDYITKSGNRLLKLVNNIIDVTRLESGFITVNFSYRNIVQVVEDTVMSTVDLAKGFNIEVIFDTAVEEINTYIDTNKIERSILNLLSNSIKFTPSEGRIYVSINVNNNEVIIKVQDTGIGIPEDKLKNIFNRFYQADSSLHRSSEGSGLGLYIVKGLIHLHHGTISVESICGEGTTFTITLPIILSIKDNTEFTSSDDDLSRLVTIELSDILGKD
ncbi:Non-motile and phage-resistance protein [uncultured Clostridium sp.]|uniref:sensor histidine kinase n=1 Tax=uncultured Clostridium sp. TaxID=59620 RepID=UPI0008224BFC|nr:HAMP domain-containing sensor histidine kinase [uncultured Clostridium sp.]SCJ61837.1 Non-motile and phage-resistance protein [uncultured Clostridium sp.]